MTTKQTKKISSKKISKDTTKPKKTNTEIVSQPESSVEIPKNTDDTKQLPASKKKETKKQTKTKKQTGGKKTKTVEIDNSATKLPKTKKKTNVNKEVKKKNTVNAIIKNQDENKTTDENKTNDENQEKIIHPRYFKVIIDGCDPNGRFSGTKPKQAANKALTSILKKKNLSGQIHFSIIECTRGSKHKQYNYIGERIKLEKPMIVKIKDGINEKIIEYRFNNKVMKNKNYVIENKIK